MGSRRSFTPQFFETLDGLEDRAWHEARAGIPDPGDFALVRLVRSLADDPGAAELDDVDDEILAVLRDAYNNGRDPGTVNMDAVVDELGKLGVPAYVEQTGGGCATIYAGKLNPWTDHHGDRRYAAAAGPGSFEGPGWSRGRGHADEFVVGPDDDGDSTPENVPADANPAQIAGMIARVVRDTEDRWQRVEDVLEQAGEAFWGAVAKGFPEVTSGDFGPDETLTIEQAMRKAMLLWLYYNRPEEGVAPTRAAGDAIVEARAEATAARLLPIAEQIDPDELWYLLHDTAHAQAEDEFIYGDFGPIGDDAAREALKDRADDRVNEARQEGPLGAVRLLVDAVGERRAEKDLREAAGLVPAAAGSVAD